MTTHRIPFKGGVLDGESLSVPTPMAHITLPEQVIEHGRADVTYTHEGWATQTERYSHPVHYIVRVYDLTQTDDGPCYVARPHD